MDALFLLIFLFPHQETHCPARACGGAPSAPPTRGQSPLICPPIPC